MGQTGKRTSEIQLHLNVAAGALSVGGSGHAEADGQIRIGFRMHFDAADLRAVAALDKFHVRPPYGVVQNVLVVAFRALFAAEGRVGRLFIADSVPSGACCSPVGVLEYRCQ